jgi:hypothetical protein
VLPFLFLSGYPQCSPVLVSTIALFLIGAAITLTGQACSCQG